MFGLEAEVQSIPPSELDGGGELMSLDCTITKETDDSGVISCTAYIEGTDKTLSFDVPIEYPIVETEQGVPSLPEE